MDSTTVSSVTSLNSTLNNFFHSENNLYKHNCFTLRFDETSNNIAAGYSTGVVSIYNLEKPETSFAYKNSYKISKFPITCIRWKPFNKTTLIAVTADGKIIHIHSKTGKTLHTIEEKKNPIMCVDYSTDGIYFATGGNDKFVRLYDDNTKTLISKLVSHRIDLPEHSNRIFAVKFSKKDPNLLLSAGWDRTILLYDLRAKSVQNFLYGPHVCGDGLDLKDDLLLTVSWAKEEQIQFFDLRNNKEIGVFIMTLFDDEDLDSSDNLSFLYSCRFNPVNSTFWVTGSNENYLRIYDYSNLNGNDLTQNKVEGILDLRDLNDPCYCYDYNLKGNKLTYGSPNKIDFINLKQ